MTNTHTDRAPSVVHPALTLRQREILQGLADGETVDEIAARLDISDETVRTHIKRTTGKLRARSRTHAVVLAMRSGLIA